MSRIYYENENTISPDEIKTFIDVCLRYRNDHKRVRRSNRVVIGDYSLGYHTLVRLEGGSFFSHETVMLGSVRHKNHSIDECVIRLADTQQYTIGKSYTREEVDEILTHICMLML